MRCSLNAHEPLANQNLEISSAILTEQPAGLKKAPSHCPGQVDFPSGHVTFHSHFFQWARDEASHLQTKSLKEQTKTCPGQTRFESYLSKGQTGIQVFFEP